MDDVQSLVPQLQALAFSTVPLLKVHAAALAHLLLDAQQNRPLDVVHVVVPQAQALTFSTVPFVTVHDGPTEHTAEEAAAV